MLSYLFEAGICWAIFSLLYFVSLKRETFFQLNRVYLLMTLLLGLIIPAIDFPFNAVAQEEVSTMAYYLQPITVTVQSLEYSMETIVVNAEKTTSFDWVMLLFWIYLVGVVFFFCRMMLGLFQIGQLYRKSEIENKKGYRLVKTPNMHSPFSFFSWLFWSKDLQLEPNEENYVLQHELAHMKQGHSLDVIFLEILSVVFWCLPPVHYYKKAIRNVHEYLADAAVYHTTPKKIYGRLLLKQAQSGQQPALAHHFFHSQLKQRIIMMSKNKSSRRSLLKYFGLAPIAIFLFFTLSTSNSLTSFEDGLTTNTFLSNMDPFDKDKISKDWKSQLKKLIKAEGFEARNEICEKFKNDFATLCSQYPEQKDQLADLAQELIDKTNAPIVMVSDKGEYQPRFMESKNGNGFSVVEEPPRFPGCEEMEGEELEACAMKAMLVHIYKGIKYPEEARTQGLEGIVVARFVVDEEGNLIDREIVRPIGGGCEEEVLRVINTMPQWVPGKHRGKAVKVQFTLPVKFKLAGDAKEEIVDKADQMPRFPGCEEGEMTKEERQKCSNNKLINFLVENITYPKDAKEAGIEGVVALQFVVDKAGHLKKPDLIKSIGYGCDETVLQIFDKMVSDIGPWTPGQMKDGKKVNVKYTLPIAFRLQGEERENIKDQVLSLPLNNFNAFPNPADDQLTINFDAEVNPTTITLLEMGGKTITEMDLKDFDGHYEGNFNIENAAAGTLILLIRQGEKVFSQKILVQR